ncbi:UNVERIFIED_CONTAM: hypothetical protein GTU68_000395 [Idotea baltica]|nr:hypothetical protein [Idotea baltica]
MSLTRKRLQNSLIYFPLSLRVLGAEDLEAGVSELTRLQKFIASCGVCSRRRAEELIKAGRIKVNGAIVVELGSKVDPAKDQVTFDDKPLGIDLPILYRFYKPTNMVTTLSDPQGRVSLADVVSQIPTRVFPVGRLDRDVSGLLLLTNDGEFSESILHPRNNVRRTYEAVVGGAVTKKSIDSLLGGVELEDGLGRFLSGKAASKDRPSSVVRVQCSEGRKHFVKKMLGAVRHPVLELIRTSFGPYSLGDMQVGELRLEKLPK